MGGLQGINLLLLDTDGGGGSIFGISIADDDFPLCSYRLFEGTIPCLQETTHPRRTIGSPPLRSSIECDFEQYRPVNPPSSLSGTLTRHHNEQPQGSLRAFLPHIDVPVVIDSPERIPSLGIIIYYGKGEVRVQTAHEVRLQKDSGEPQNGCACGDLIDLLLLLLLLLHGFLEAACVSFGRATRPSCVVVSLVFGRSTGSSEFSGC